MIWLICWISREALHSGIPMISSTSQRLPRKTCGLFDTGFAGDNLDVTSPGFNLSAPVAVDSLGAFGLDTSFYGTPGVKEEVDKPAVVQEPNDDWMDELENLSGDPLGDDSMEAFVNLDQFLNGNSLFDEEGNLTLLNGEDDEPAAEVAPVINFGQHSGDAIINTLINDCENFTAQETDMHDFLLPPEEQVVQTPLKICRKRPAQSAIKTSLYEIPAPVVNIPTTFMTTVEQVLSDTELDHDYSSKRQRMTTPSEMNQPSTSGTVTNKKFSRPYSLKLNAAIPKTVLTPSEDYRDPVFLDDSMDKQTIRRIKNNHASKRSREQRKQKLSDMDIEAEELELKNQELKEKIVELEKLAKEMKAALVAKMAGK